MSRSYFSLDQYAIHFLLCPCDKDAFTRFLHVPKLSNVHVHTAPSDESYDRVSNVPESCPGSGFPTRKRRAPMVVRPSEFYSLEECLRVNRGSC